MIAKTLGNRRLGMKIDLSVVSQLQGDNLITGLERLLPYIVELDNKSLATGFPVERFDESRGMCLSCKTDSHL